MPLSSVKIVRFARIPAETRMDERADINLDNESRELILVEHAMAIAGEADRFSDTSCDRL